MWKLEHKEIWALKNWRFWTVVLEKTLESLLDCKKIKQSILKEISPEYSLEGLMQKLQYFGHMMRRTDSFGKDPDAGKDRRQEEKGATEDEMVGWHHWLGHEFEQAPRVGDGQGNLACCSAWGRKSWIQLNDWTELWVWWGRGWDQRTAITTWSFTVQNRANSILL